MTQLLILGLSGAFLGAGLSARRRGAPIVMAKAFYVFALVSLGLAVIAFQPNT